MQSNIGFEPKSTNKKKFESLLIHEGFKSYWRMTSRNDNKEKKPNRDSIRNLFTYPEEK